jgi:hypothetical protein
MVKKMEIKYPIFPKTKCPLEHAFDFLKHTTKQPRKGKNK